jgi:twitching motility two-component system response regulator PilH
MARDAATKHIPVVIVSTKAMETDKAWGLRQGAADYIVKPPREEELIARINQLVV